MTTWHENHTHVCRFHPSCRDSRHGSYTSRHQGHTCRSVDIQTGCGSTLSNNIILRFINCHWVCDRMMEIRILLHLCDFVQVLLFIASILHKIMCCRENIATTTNNNNNKLSQFILAHFQMYRHWIPEKVTNFMINNFVKYLYEWMNEWIFIQHNYCQIQSYKKPAIVCTINHNDKTYY